MKSTINFIRSDYRIRLSVFVSFLFYYDSFMILPFIKNISNSVLVLELIYNIAIIIFLMLIYKNRNTSSKYSLYTNLIYPLTLGALIPLLINRIQLVFNNRTETLIAILLLSVLTIYFTAINVNGYLKER